MKTSEEIQTWLRERIAKEIKIKPETVSLHATFAGCGIDSLVIVTLVNDLEEWLNVSLDPTIFWEYPTIKDLTDWLLSEDFSNR
jgi:acyl carrier protein